MSRSGYYHGGNEWAFICWRGAVAQAIRGRRGQVLLREMAEVLDAMPVKELVAGALQDGDKVCALGAVGVNRGMNMAELDPKNPLLVAHAFGIARALAAEIAYINDEDPFAGTLGRARWDVETTRWLWQEESPADRWARVRKWVGSKLLKGDSK